MNLKEKILVISIALLFVFFVHYGLNTFMKEPQDDDYCNTSSFYEYPEMMRDKASQPVALIDYGALSCGNISTEQLCRKLTDQYACEQTSEENRQSEQECYDRKGMPTYTVQSNGCNVYKDCSFCNLDFEKAREKYNRIVFISAGIVGIAAMIIGAAMLALESVGAGIMGGGVLTVIYGTIRYWGNLPDVGRFVMLGIALAVLIWLGYKKLATGKGQGKKNKK